MKRFAILFTLVVTLGILAAMAARSRRGGHHTDAVYLVVASDADGNFRRGGPRIWLCGGTQAAGGDEVQIRAAVDACDAAGGGVVELSPGTFYVALPATETDVVFTADITDATASGTLANLSFSVGASGDIAVGQVYRCSGGADNGNSLEDNNRDQCGTISSLGPPIVFLEDFDGVDYTGATFVRMRGAVQLKGAVEIIGQGPQRTTIMLANGENCCVVIGDSEATTAVGGGISHLTIDGNRANQGDEDNTAPYTFHPECNGLVASFNYWDLEFERLTIIGCDGDGRVILQPWGSVIYGGGWTEWCSGSGLVYGAGSDGALMDHKIAEVVEANARDAHASNRLVGDGNTFTAAGLLARTINSCKLSPSYIASDYQWGIWMWGGFCNRIVDVDIDQYGNATNLGGIRADSAGASLPNQLMVANCTIECPTASTYGILLNARGTIISGNQFRNCPNPIEILSNSFDAEIHGNYRAWITDATRSVASQRPNVHVEFLNNDSGSTVGLRMWVKYNADYAHFALADASTTATTVLGYCRLGATNGTSRYIQVEGYHPLVDFDDHGAPHAIAVGDPLCCSDDGGDQGRLVEAASGDWVVAIAQQAHTGEAVAQKAVYILPEWERYAEP